MVSIVFLFFGCKNKQNDNATNDTNTTPITPPTNNDSSNSTTDKITLEQAQQAISGTVKVTHHRVESGQNFKTEYTVTNPFDKDIEVSVDAGANIYTHSVQANTTFTNTIWDSKILQPTIKLTKMTDSSIDFSALGKEIHASLRFVEKQSSQTQTKQYEVYAKNPLSKEVQVQLKVKNSYSTTTTLLSANQEGYIATVNTNSANDILLEVVSIYDNYAQQNQQIQSSFKSATVERLENSIESSIQFSNPFSQTCEILLTILYPNENAQEKMITLSGRKAYFLSFTGNAEATFSIQVLSIQE